MKWNKLYKYPKSTRSLIEGNRHYDINQEMLPSVTTILQETQSDEKKASLANWRQKVGENEAERIKNEAASRGTAMHQFLEFYLRNEKILDLSDEGQVASGMGQVIIDQGFSDLKEIWGSEVTLFYPGLYAGSTDLCGIYSGRESIIDFKQTNKPKRKEWIDEYFMQLGAYAMAHDVIYNTCVDQGVILMCSKDGFFQKFTSTGKEFTRFKHKFLEKVGQFYQKKGQKK
jgi:genome maintenance exonuclease 1